MKFSEMRLSAKTLSALDSLNFTEPTEVQEKTIPLLLGGNELMVRSQTGTGKTAAFGIAMIEQIAADKSCKGLILAPTRELAIQIAKDLRAIAINHRLRIDVIYGGDDMNRQVRFLQQGFDIVVATPGRLLDHVRRGTLNLSVFNLIVLDEADRMLDMGFRDDIDAILGQVNKSRQMMLFSATLTGDIRLISRKYMHAPELIEIGDIAKAPSIHEQTFKVRRREKFDQLQRLLHQEPGSRIIIFVATQRATEYLERRLGEVGVRSESLHGGIRQNRRERIVRDFSEGRFRILIATDVASRGLHIEDIAHVINYDEARDKDTHLHRIGRTGRMGKSGKATTFIELDPRPSFMGAGGRMGSRTGRPRRGFFRR